MENRLNQSEFDVLGQKIRYRPESGSEQTNAASAVELVNQKAETLKKLLGASVNNEQLAVLTALQMAQDTLQMRQQFETNLTQVKTKAQEAFNLVSEVIPNIT